MMKYKDIVDLFKNHPDSGIALNEKGNPIIKRGKALRYIPKEIYDSYLEEMEKEYQKITEKVKRIMKEIKCEKTDD